MTHCTTMKEFRIAIDCIADDGPPTIDDSLRETIAEEADYNFNGEYTKDELSELDNEHLVDRYYWSCVAMAKKHGLM